ncbi:MAG TPA: hypothetical protein VEY09_17075 [Pyrinomonadaceae bacterium]|nr:hypothetical protein [Pyrinomonadaceae bacterium]
MVLLRSTTGGRRARRLLAVCVLAALCFSAGEGVRLVPLPDAHRGSTVVGDATASCGQPERGPALRLRGGSLDLPAKIQQRPKRQTDACVVTLGAGADYSIRALGCSADPHPTDLYARAFEAPGKGRAPPRSS